MVSVGIVGVGLVGKCVLKQIAPIASKYNINVVLVARSSKTLASADYSPLAIGSALDDLNAQGEAAWSPTQVAEFLSKSSEPAVLIDNTSDETLANSYPEFVKRGVSVVTPNKKAFSSSIELWDEIFDKNSKALVYHESTVGAGLPIISSVKDLVETGDKIVKIEGILSGSLSFLFNNFGASDSSKWSDIVAEAKQLGYTEPDPRDDLSGMDFARKVTILARLAGVRVAGPTAFPVDSLIPEALKTAASGDEFLAGLPKYDDDMAKLRSEAKSEGKVLRYVGTADLSGSEPKVSVGIQKFDASHPFASLSGSDNVVAFTTERYPSPLIVQGAGAGDAVTAMGVVSDLIKVVQRLN